MLKAKVKESKERKLIMEKKKVVCVGCGYMGGKLINGFMESGHEVAIVEIVASKAEEFVARGASCHSKLSEAIKAFDPDLIVFNLPTYELDTVCLNEAADYVNGKCVVNLSTGTAEKVLKFKNLVDSLGGKFIVGVITCYPRNIGADRGGSLFFAGDESTYNNVKDILASLSPTNIYMGEDVAAAPGMDVAFLTAHYGLYWGVIQAAESCKKNNIPVELFADAVKPMMMSVLDIICPNLKSMVAKDDYCIATDSDLYTHAPSINLLVEFYTSHGMDDSVFKGIKDLVDTALENGDGDKNFEAIAKYI